MAEERGRFTLAGEHGLHARPAAVFVKTAGGFDSEIVVRKGDREANAKSLLKVLALGADQGDEIEIEARGADAAQAVAALGELVSKPAA